MTDSYIYSSENRLQHPCTYMYTPFEGAAFLDAYLASREGGRTGGLDVASALDDRVYRATRDRLRQAHAGTKNAAFQSWLSDQLVAMPEPAPSKVAAEPPAWPDAEDSVEAMPLLARLVHAVDRADEGTEVKRWSGRFVQRFEVTKRIYADYQPGLKKGSGDYLDPMPYALLGYVCARMYDKDQNLKYLNALLKLNDLLCSLQDQGGARPIAWCVCLYEECLVRELLVRKGMPCQR